MFSFKKRKNRDGATKMKPREAVQESRSEGVEAGPKIGKSSVGRFSPGMFAALCGLVGVGLSLGLVHLLNSGAGAENKLVKYVYSLVFERGNIQFITIFFFWFALGLIIEKSLFTRREESGFADAAIKEFQEKATSGDKYGATTVLGLLETFEASCTKFGQSLPILYNRILQGLKQAKISTNQGDVANVLTSVENVDYEKMESSYNMIKFLIWIIPILGFIGTLIGMSGSIGSFQGVFDSMKSASTSTTMEEAISGQLNQVTSGLALAFDTTLLALVLSACLNFFMTKVLRREENLLVKVNDFVLENIINRFSSVKSQLKPAPDFSGGDREETRHRELLKGISDMKDKLAQKIQDLEYGVENLQSGQGDSAGKLSDRIAGLVEVLEKQSGAGAGAGSGAAGPMPIKGFSSPAGGGARKSDGDFSGFAKALESLQQVADGLDLNLLKAPLDQLNEKFSVMEGLGSSLKSIETLPEVMTRLADSQKDMVEAMTNSAAKLDFSPLTEPLDELNRNMVQNAQAIAGLSDFKEHLEANNEKMDEMNKAINELVRVNRSLGKLMTTLIGDTFGSEEK